MVDDIMLDTIKEMLNSYNIIQIFENELELIEKIGEGSQGKVFKGKYKGNFVAIKALEELDMKNFVHELYILSKINHKCIPRLYGLVVEENNISLVTEYINGICLDKLILKNSLSFENKLKISVNLCKVLFYIHSKNYIHRDLKPENMIVDLDSFEIHLIDFGIAKCLQNKDEDCKTRVMGTVFYIAPEIFDEVETNSDGEVIGHYTSKSDVWSFGCILSFLFSGIFPWTNKIDEKKLVNKKALNTLIENFIMEKEKFPIPNTVDDRIKKVIEKATEIDVEARLNMGELLELLENM
jgi:serine/threonine protein kinase